MAHSIAASSEVPAKVRFDVIVGAVVKHLRVSKQSNQADAADQSGLPASTWSRLESGRSGMTVAQVFRVARSLGVQPSEIMEIVGVLVDVLDSQGVDVEWPARGKVADETAWYLDTVSIENLLQAIQIAPTRAS